MRSPIERMVDAACGITAEQRAELEAKQADLEANGVLLYCPCGAKKWDERIPEYEDFDVIEVECPSCRPTDPDRSNGNGG